MKAAQEAWFAAQPDLDPERLVFVDETAANTKMARRYGRAPRGRRCRMALPHDHYATTTVTAARAPAGPAPSPCSTGRPTARASAPTSPTRWPRFSGAATSSSWTTSGRTR